MVEVSIYMLPGNPKPGEPSCRIGYQVFEADDKYWYDILDYDVPEGDLPIHIEQGSRGFKRSQTADRHAKKAVQKVKDSIASGKKIDWR